MSRFIDCSYRGDPFIDEIHARLDRLKASRPRSANYEAVVEEIIGESESCLKHFADTYVKVDKDWAKWKQLAIDRQYFADGRWPKLPGLMKGMNEQLQDKVKNRADCTCYRVSDFGVPPPQIWDLVFEAGALLGVAAATVDRCQIRCVKYLSRTCQWYATVVTS